MSLVVFDFDGVLFDTARESLEVAYQTVRTLPWAGRWRDQPNVPAADAELYFEHRHWVGPPWQYAVLFRCIAEGALPRTTDEFMAIAAREEPSLRGFTDAYFATRAKIAADRERWVALTAPYPAATRELVALHERGLARVLSTRDDNSIRLLIRYHLGLELADGVLLPRSGPKPKWEILLATHEPPASLLFLDDHLGHALPAYQHGIAARLATWGYASADDKRAALTAGLPCLQLDELSGAISAHLELS